MPDSRDLNGPLRGRFESDSPDGMDLTLVYEKETFASDNPDVCAAHNAIAAYVLRRNENV